MNFYGDVNNATGNVKGDQNSSNSTRNINIKQGNYNENIEGDYIEGN